MGDSEPVYTLDEALAMVGFGKYQGLLLAYGGLGCVAEAMEVMILSFIGGAVESEWHLSPGEKSLISTVVFAGMLVGAYFWGFIADRYGRKKSILGLSTITSIAGLLSAFSPNYMSLIVLRCIAGVGLGAMHVFLSWFLEFIPVPNRGVWMIVFSSFWTVGTIFESALAWIVMPSFGWRWLLAISSGPCFIILLLYSLIPESPRFLCMKGKIKEAHNVLEKAASFNEVPGMILAAFIVDRVGRKLCMMIMFVLSSILLIPLLTHQNEVLTTALLFGARALVSAAFTVACIYCPEIYPTSIRGSAVGIASAVGRIGGMICPLVAVVLVDNCQQTYAVILFQVVILGCALSVFLSPFETKGRNLVDVQPIE